MDKHILKQLYESYSREIFLYLFSLCHSVSTAEDLMQETFLKAILSLSKDHTNMRGWLYLVARNLYFNYRKKHKMEVFYETTEPSVSEQEILDQIVQDDKKRMLYQAMNQMDERKREVLVLQYFSGMSQKQIAATLNLSPENVRILAYRGKRELRRIMEGNGYDLS
ncbi:MAG: RNA polymerase sigma factor [Clostridiales bacterium]|nr:RNA polymerase sigma factor [Clostridiales bacterium]